MVEPQNAPSTSTGNLPEPPLDELYGLYLRSLAHRRMQSMAPIADPSFEEEVAKAMQPVSKARFAEYLEECAARGTRAWFVNRMVLGPEYCDAHGDDPRIQRPTVEPAVPETEARAEWARAIVAGRAAHRLQGHEGP